MLTPERYTMTPLPAQYDRGRLQAELQRIQRGIPHNLNTSFFDITDRRYGGAVPDGKDNTTVIQATIDAARDAGGGIVLVPGGRFYANGGVDLYSGVSLRGVGQRFSELYAPDNDVDVIRVQGTAGWSPPVVQVAVEGLKITGPGEASGSTGRGIFAQYGAVGIMLRDLWVVAHGSHGVAFDNTYSATLADLLLDSNGGDGFHAETNANNIDVRRCIAVGNSGRGYAVVGGTTLTFINADAESNTGAGFDLRYTFAASLLGCHMEQNGHDGTSPNIYLHYRSSSSEPATATTIRGCLIQGSGVTVDGIVVDGANATTIEDNWFNNHTTDHIRTTATATRTKIGRNTYGGTGTELTDGSSSTATFGPDQSTLIWKLSPGFYMPEQASAPGTAPYGVVYRSNAHNGHLRYKPADGIIRSLLMGLEGSDTLTWASIPANSTSEQTIAVSGAAVGDAVSLYALSSLAPGLMAMAFVSAANTVTVRVANVTTGALTPGTGGWRVRVIRSAI